MYIQYVCMYIQYVCMYIYSMCSTFLSSLIMQLCVTHPVPMGSVLLMTLAIVLDSVDPLAAYQVSCYTHTHTHTHTYTHIHTHMYMVVCVHVCMYIQYVFYVPFCPL